MSSEGLHVPREKLRKETLHLHYAITSLIEELEAVDWYRQRADDTDDRELRAILLHNANEEIEHAAMALEWIRRNDAAFAARFSIRSIPSILTAVPVGLFGFEIKTARVVG